MGATYPHPGRWATLPHQMNYGAKEELILWHQRAFYILCEFRAVFQRTGSGPRRGLGRHNNSLEPKTVSARNLATAFFLFSELF